MHEYTQKEGLPTCNECHNIMQWETPSDGIVLESILNQDVYYKFRARLVVFCSTETCTNYGQIMPVARVENRG